MAGPGGCRLLFLDVEGPLLRAVDGPLIPVRSAAAARSCPAADAGSCLPGAGFPGNPPLARLNPEHGPALLALGCDLVWASSWMAEANEEIAPRIGLPQLPVVDWPEDQLADAAGPAG